MPVHPGKKHKGPAKKKAPVKRPSGKGRYA